MYKLHSLIYENNFNVSSVKLPTGEILQPDMSLYVLCGSWKLRHWVPSMYPEMNVAVIKPHGC